MERKSEEFPILVAQGGALNGQRWLLRSGLVIGREAGCDIVIPDRQISRRHARLNVTPQGAILEDLGSKNGTYRNGKRVESPAALQDGDIVQVALVQMFNFLSSDATVPLEGDFMEEAAAAGGKLRLEKRSRRVWIGGQEVLPPLSVSQYKLLEVLYDNAGRVVTRRQLIQVIWGEDDAVVISEQALDALIRRLRDRLGEFDSTQPYIATVRGHGLRLDNPPEG
ncbi:MAG: FHA domain-containing protein [Chloroflexi bacterium]|nr:FHA domain-containing protein [Chloroflexota bacterium]